ncbi:hypothetical protein GIB67_021320 [Kingdonia uniflora]|uniref:GDSL esterase/lipase n=1 Tax=Kingdonia uniflora TaxID=39325 RepID=A0A7J7LY64_9MAGN|nr:hypothetical protein GIB67_021320 [Kingdonia uniflora]
MGVSKVTLSGFLLVLVAMMFSGGYGQPLVPALNIFGDSVVDVGNNNNRLSLVKANFPPYGRDWVAQTPTGRFCNGKLATDFTAENLGFTSYPPAYLSNQAKGENLLTGANFASAACGYYDTTSRLYNAISLPQQLDHYKEYQATLTSIAGPENASSITAGAIHLLSAGSSDFVQNYYINPFLFERYTADQFSDVIMQSFSAFIQGRNQCLPKLNGDAVSFNEKLNLTAQSLQSNLEGSVIVVFDIYQPLLDLIMKPSDNGFGETRRACCGTGTIETSLLCNSRSLGTCTNASGYIFWDGFHPSEAANKVLADALLLQGIPLIS